MAGPTRLELATSGLTGRRSNQLNYDPALYSILQRINLNVSVDLSMNCRFSREKAG